MTANSWLIIARVSVTLALLGVAALLFLVDTLGAERPLAEVIVGTVLGYWLGHAEVATVNVATEKL